MLYFVTGNVNKFQEANSILGDLKQLQIDLPEIQEIDPQKIIRQKLISAFEYTDGEFIVEDTSLYLACLNGLPGPLVKWFLAAIGNEGLARLVKKYGDNAVVAKTCIGYAKSCDEIYFFEGELHGYVVAPRGEASFGWDPIFQPLGYERTFAEMSQKQKNEISMRKIALIKLKEFLSQ